VPGPDYFANNVVEQFLHVRPRTLLVWIFLVGAITLDHQPGISEPPQTLYASAIVAIDKGINPTTANCEAVAVNKNEIAIKESGLHTVAFDAQKRSHARRNAHTVKPCFAENKMLNWRVFIINRTAPSGEKNIITRDGFKVLTNGLIVKFGQSLRNLNWSVWVIQFAQLVLYEFDDPNV
jgi:hypothetical protein